MFTLSNICGKAIVQSYTEGLSDTHTMMSITCSLTCAIVKVDLLVPLATGAVIAPVGIDTVMLTENSAIDSTLINICTGILITAPRKPACS